MMPGNKPVQAARRPGRDTADANQRQIGGRAAWDRNCRITRQFQVLEFKHRDREIILRPAEYHLIECSRRLAKKILWHRSVLRSSAIKGSEIGHTIRRDRGIGLDRGSRTDHIGIGRRDG